MLSEPTDKTTAFSLLALLIANHVTDSLKQDHSKQILGEFILSVVAESLVFKQFLCSGDFFGYFLHSRIDQNL